MSASIGADVTAGEYGSDVGYFQRMCAAGAVDCLQIDATRCGGYTEWFRSAVAAASHELTVSGHCAPNLHAPAAAATPNLRHLEWFHDHVRIEGLAFDGAFAPTAARSRRIANDRVTASHCGRRRWPGTGPGERDLATATPLDRDEATRFVPRGCQVNQVHAHDRP